MSDTPEQVRQILCRWRYEEDYGLADAIVDLRRVFDPASLSLPTSVGGLSSLPKPTHWMDDRGLVATDEFLNGPRGSSDWRAAYNIPGRMVRGKFVRDRAKQPVIDGGLSSRQDEEGLLACVTCGGPVPLAEQQAGAPHLAHDELGEVTLEWWNGDRKITMYPAQKMLLKVWGSNVETEMEDVGLEGEVGHRACEAAFAWLVSPPLPPDKPGSKT